MNCTGVNGKQTEFDFYSSLKEKINGGCAGPLVLMVLRGFALEEIKRALLAVGVSSTLEEAVVDLDGSVFSKCSGHWLDISVLLEGLGTQKQKDSWLELSYLLFRQICKGNDWDHREILNYLKSLETGYQLNG